MRIRVQLEGEKGSDTVLGGVVMYDSHCRMQSRVIRVADDDDGK